MGHRAGADGEPGLATGLTAEVFERLRREYGEEFVESVADATGIPLERLLDPNATIPGDAFKRLGQSVLDGFHGEMQRRAQQLEAAREQLIQTERLAAMGRLVSGVAHEVNNPLTGIRADAELLQARVGDPELVAIGDAIASQVDRCSRLIRNMLAFGRQQPSSREPFDLARVVDRALGLHAFHLRMAKLEIERPRVEGGPVVLGDPGQLQQVVHNLVDNALAALAREPNRRRLAIRLRAVPEGALLEVEDSGPGIPAEDRERVLEPFFTTKRSGEGTGLGLSICHGIVLSHGGRMEIGEPAGGSGTRVRVWLPSSADDPTASRRRSEAGPTAPASRQESSTLSGVSTPRRREERACYRLLVVDDESPILDAISRLLRDLGHEVVPAGGAAAAREALFAAVTPFDAILLDLKMPDETGLEFYSSLPEDLQRRVVFMTGALAFRSSDEFLSRFWGRFVEKPFTYRDLSRVLRRVTGPA